MRLRRRRRKPHKPKLRIVFSVCAVILTIMLFVRTEKNIKPYARLQAEHFADKTANEIIEHSVSDYLEENKYTYSDFAAVLYDNSQNVVSVETMPYTVNKVQSDLSLLINDELGKSGKRSAEIPVGTLTDSYLLNGKGPKIRIRVVPIGVASVKLRSDFDNAGLNQTKHRISAVISVKMNSSSPLYTFDVRSEFEFILAENILVGDVPQISPYIRE